VSVHTSADTILSTEEIDEMRDKDAKITDSDQQAIAQAIRAMKSGDLGPLGKLLQQPKLAQFIGELIAPMAGDLIKKLDELGMARHRSELYDSIASPLARSVGCGQDEMASWLLLNAEPNAVADIAQRQAAGRAAAKLGARTIMLEVLYTRLAAGRYAEVARAWLISAAGAVEHTSERSVSLDALPDTARSALVAGEQTITFKLIK
jgi:hypothetical protein